MVTREEETKKAEQEKAAEREPERFKSEINLVEYAQSQGYAVVKRESSKHSVAMRNEVGDKIVVATGQDGHDIYFGVRGCRLDHRLHPAPAAHESRTGP